MSTSKNVFKTQRLEAYDQHVLFHGAKMSTFFQPLIQKSGISKRGKIEIWLKVLFLIVDFYLKNSSKDHDFFVSTKAICNKLNAYGNNYHIRSIQKAIEKCVKLGLISKVPYPATEEELVLNPRNQHLRRRKLIPDMNKIKEFLNVYDGQDKILKSLPKKHPLKKLIYKRPFSYTEKIEDKYNEYTTTCSTRRPYKNVKEMYVYWCIYYSDKYFDCSQIVSKFKPTNIQNNIQERVDEAFVSKTSHRGTITSATVSYLADGLSYLDPDEYYNMIGWKVPSELVPAAKKIGFEVTNRNFIASWTNPVKHRAANISEIQNSMHDSTQMKKPPESFNKWLERL